MKKKGLLLALALIMTGSLASWGQLYRATTVKTELPAKGDTCMIWDDYTYNGGTRTQNRTWLLMASQTSNTLQAYGYGASQTDQNAPKITDLKVNSGGLFIVGNDESGNYTFKSVLRDKYVSITSSQGAAYTLSDTPVGFTIVDGAKGDNTDLKNVWNIQDATAGTSFYWNGNYNSTATWENPHPYQFWSFEKIPSISVTYVCKSQSGDDLGTIVSTVEYGSKYAPKAPTISLYKYVSMDCDTDSVVGTEDKTINVVYAENFPFKTSKVADGATSFPTDASWYLMTIAAGKYYLSYTPGETAIPVVTTKTAITQAQDSDLWCFTGNPKDGFRIYNKAAGAGKILSSTTQNVAGSDNGGSTFPLLTDISAIDPATANTTWDVSNGYFTDGYYFAQHGIAANRMNYRKPNLAYWTGGADAGSTFTFKYVNVNNPNLQALQDLLATVKPILEKIANADEPGYPSTDAYTSLKDAYDQAMENYSETMGEDAAKDNYTPLKEAYDNFKAAPVSTTPVEWSLYKITNINGRGFIYYYPSVKKYPYTSAKLAMAKDADPKNMEWLLMPVTGTSNYYLYNVGRQRFVAPTVDNGPATTTNPWMFSANPTELVVTFNSTNNSFTFKTASKGTYMSISPSYDAPVIDYYADGDGGLPFTFDKLGTADETIKAQATKALHPVGLTDYSVAQGYQTTGRGNKNAVILRIGVIGNSTEKTMIDKFYATLKGKTATDVDNVKLYLTSKDNFNLLTDADKTLLGTAQINGNVATFTPEINEIGSETAYLWLTADVKSNAVFGDTIDATADSLTFLTMTTNQKGTVTMDGDNDPSFGMKIFGSQSFVYSPTQNGCYYYRIPAMTVAKDGSLIAACDMRYDSNADLGSHKIDIAVRRSTDNGLTWGPQTIIAVGDSTSDNAFGYGDPALVTVPSGKIVCLMAAGKNSFATGIKNIALTTSSDNGQNWDAAPTDLSEGLLTNELDNSMDLKNVYSTFVSSGKGLVTSKGRVMFAVDSKVGGSAAAETNYILYSDDNGDTWTLNKNLAYNNGNEAKLVEMNDGSIMISVRQNGKRGFNTSTDNGVTWGTQSQNTTLIGANCNADILYYSRSTEGADDVMLHTICNTTDNTRKNLKLYVSRDQGATWGGDIAIQGGAAGYSTMVKLSDGSVGIFFEDGSISSAYTLNFITIPATNIATAINNINADSKVNGEGNNVYYDLSGRRIAKPSKGLYITKGRKFIAK
jgi:sialidase-1